MRTQASAGIVAKRRCGLVAHGRYEGTSYQPLFHLGHQSTKFPVSTQQALQTPSVDYLPLPHRYKRRHNEVPCAVPGSRRSSNGRFLLRYPVRYGNCAPNSHYTAYACADHLTPTTRYCRLDSFRKRRRRWHVRSMWVCRGPFRHRYMLW